MKFAIGIESFLPNTDDVKMFDQVDDSELECVDDNLAQLEMQDYSSAMESINQELGFLIKHTSLMVGVEADEISKPATNKDPIYKRIWDAIKKMFNTLGKWMTTAYNWVAKKFGFGGSENPATVATSEAAMTAEVINEVVDNLTEAGGVEVKENESKEAVVKREVKKAIKAVILKRRKAAKDIPWLVPIIEKNVVEHIVEHVVETEKQVETSSEPVKVVTVEPDKIGEYKFTAYLLDIKNSDAGVPHGTTKGVQRAASSLKEGDIDAARYFYIDTAGEIIRTVGSCLTVLFEDVKFPYIDYVKLDELIQRPLKDEANVKMLQDLITRLSDDVTKIKSKNVKLNLKEVNYTFKTVNGKIDREDAVSKITASNDYNYTEKFGKYLEKYAKLIPNHMDAAIAGLNSIDTTKLQDSGNIEDIKLIKANIVNLRNIASSLTSLLSKNSMKTLRKSLVGMKKVDDEIYNN